mmetsp:Transcript_5714/g.12227  ORF Transcript_5714/g.12227 Transcript_5714/m.12227 type:complete len:284 (+) Transcript_5714:606-1457(+)
MLLPRQKRPGKTIPRLESFRRRNRHASLGQICLQFIKYRRPQPCRNIPRHARYNSPYRVSLLPYLVDPLQHPRRRCLIRTSYNIGIDIFHGKGVVIDILRFDLLHFGNVRQNLDIIVQFQNLARHRSGGDATDGLASGTPSSPGDGADSVFGIVGGIGVTGTVGDAHVVFEIISRSLILVPNQHGERGAQGDILGVYPREDFDGIGFVAGGGDAGLSGAATIEIDLDFVAGDGDAGWTAVEGDADASSVGFAPGGDAEETAEGVAGAHAEGEGCSGGERGEEG